MIDYSKFYLSLKRLEEQQDNYLKLDADQPELICEGIAESVIQRFETCYDCLWKVVKRHLIEEMGIAEPPNSPKPTFRLANENGLLPSPVEQWFKYADARTDTSHDYDGQKAKACLGLVPTFIGDAIHLYHTLSGKSWH
ncbi:MAG: nucleotidyltransferase substrate binding protein [Rhodobacteraceae bacterium]|nr:nucleotidyltransferase substrate binding protein [Paracoccaceae bacterium]MCY4198008.1 nucleotidyltransferase substrate binding protein [Paracoccaceae bacterium]MCY4327405.1 nucleotidyltransferase substrate binding protein [Paracoccaceae bacterium]